MFLTDESKSSKLTLTFTLAMKKFLNSALKIIAKCFFNVHDRYLQRVTLPS